MHFKISLKRFSKLIFLLKVSRTKGGLYLIWAGPDESHVSYHEDGKYWVRSRGAKVIKKLRQPLSSFVGAETLSSGVYSHFGPMPDDRDESATAIRSNDVVIDYPATFGMEIILTDAAIHLPEVAGRKNSRVFVMESRPLIIVEAFEFQDRPFLSDRFPPSTTWIEGSNFFVNHQGRI